MSSPKRPEGALPWFVLGVFVALTLLATWYVWSSTRDADRARFDNAVQSTRDAIQSRIETYVNVLTATRGLVVADPGMPRDLLRAYIRSLNVHVRYPGIQGVGVSIRIPSEEVRQLEAEMRSGGYPKFRVWPESEGPLVHTIVLVEPQDRRNEVAMGFNMSTNPTRREAMERARDDGRPAATAPVTLVHEMDGRTPSGFLIYTPIYATGTTPPTLAQRRDALIGFVYAPFRANDLFPRAFGSQKQPELGFEVWDGQEMLYRSTGISDEPRFTDRTTLQIAGRLWHFRWASRREGAGPALFFAFATFFGGMVIATLLFTLIRVQMRARETAEATAERLRQSEGALQRANVAKDEFLATLSHELRTPMTAILGWSEMLKEPDLDDESEGMAVDAIRRGAQVQAQLIDDLLDVSRITAGKMKIEPKTVELAGVVSAAVETVRAPAQAKEIELSEELAEKLCVNGDDRRLQQVVWNLLTNAVKFTPAGGKVSVRLRQEGNQAVIEVEDTGHGIEPEFMPFIFDRFRQADSSTTRSHMGLGLGLAIVRHLVELHGGTIAAESQGKDRGSLFRVRLPLLQEAMSGEAAPETVRADVLRGKRILIVDDDAEVRSYLVAVFRASGVDVSAASSAKAALGRLQEWPADLVLSDLGMPEADGFDLLHWIRSSEIERVRNVPVVALTAFAMPEDRQRALDGGFQGFVAKPVEPGELRKAISSVL
ncbi:MAG TPA: CHASE domain-containing protein [Thermoanaerobaculia bacterium]|nr:CHASE domain-containing protein [Thermoanaerobaculia bacterium]